VWKKEQYKHALHLNQRKEYQDLLFKIAKVGMYWQDKKGENQVLDLKSILIRKSFSKWKSMSIDASNTKQKSKPIKAKV